MKIKQLLTTLAIGLVFSSAGQANDINSTWDVRALKAHATSYGIDAAIAGKQTIDYQIRHSEKFHNDDKHKRSHKGYSPYRYNKFFKNFEHFKHGKYKGKRRSNKHHYKYKYS